MILAGDIGGTKSVLALFEAGTGYARPTRETVFASSDYATFRDLLREFLVGCPAKVSAVALGVAGPVLDGRCQATNLPWTLDEREVAADTGAPRVKLLNDLEAAAYGILQLPPRECALLNPGDDPGRKGTIAVLAAGTGLGEAILHWDGERYHAIASEGGHTDFAPRNEREVELLRFLWARHGGRVSYERVLSGPGILALYSFLRYGGMEPEPTWLTVELEEGDPAAVIAAAGLANRDSVCAGTLELFAEIYGAEAGNLALKCMAFGGVLIGGGIAPKILPVLRRGSFMRGFTSKGRFSPVLARLEVRVALNQRAALLGAAACAQAL